MTSLLPSSSSKQLIPKLGFLVLGSNNGFDKMRQPSVDAVAANEALAKMGYTSQLRRDNLSMISVLGL